MTDENEPSKIDFLQLLSDIKIYLREILKELEKLNQNVAKPSSR